ncbi:MAG: response regulator transcription factor [bacterium]
MRILLVEDERKLSQLIEKILKQQNYAVDVAYDGESGLQKALIEEYDLLILDWTLPERDGLSILSTLREREKKTPVLMLTSRSGVEDMVTGLDTGADDYLAKPFAKEVLLARVRVLLRRPTEVRTSSITIADLEIDLKAKIATRAGQMLNLAPREFALLEYLATHEGEALSREDILSHVWDEFVDPFSNTVDVHIAYLRKKVDRPFSQKLILTVSGIGYKIAAP